MLLLAAYVVYVTAVTNLSWVQNPRVPSGTYQVYRSDGTTQITASSDQTSIWQWHPETTSFNTTIIIRNTGATTINATVVLSGLNSEWTPNGEGTYVIPPTTNKPVALAIVNPDAVAEEYVGQFTVTVTA
jgi:hypothetical protein